MKDNLKTTNSYVDVSRALSNLHTYCPRKSLVVDE